ncbi:MAG: hypothetical protein PWP24_23 [Clostridiales bacterium]|nr:hypothetical protein [Clostridiales bacterium]
MTVATIQSLEKQGSLLAPSKITDDNKLDMIIQPSKQDDAVVVSKGENETRIDPYSEVQGEAKESKAESKKKEDNSDKSGDERLKDASNQMTEADYWVLQTEGISMEAYDGERLAKALERIKENYEFRQEAVRSFVADKEQMEDTVKKIAIGCKISDPMAKKLAQKLVDANMPVTEENIQSLMGALGMSGAVTNISEGAKVYLIDNQEAPTIEAIYFSQYSGSTTAAFAGTAKTADGNDFERVKSQVQKIVDEAGLSDPESAMEDAKWLYENKLPITEESLSTLQAVNKLKGKADEDFLLDKMITAMKTGKKPEEASLDDTNETKVLQAMEGYEKLYDEVKNSNDIASITATRKLEEIRLKMTKDAGLALLSKGITLDTDHLEQVVEGLKQLEADYYKGLFSEASYEAYSNQIALLKETTQTLKEVGEAPAYVLGATLNRRSIQTLEEFHEASSSMKATLDEAKVAYDTVKTEPRSDMGDSIKKAFRNIPELLESMQLEDNQENERAVRILAYNQMDITKDSVDAVKSYDSKVNRLINALKPPVVVELIRQDNNPLTMNMDELTQKATAIQKELGDDGEQKYSEYLWKLSHTEGISESEKSSYIGIYRLLQNVEKTDGAAIGALLQSGRELSLKNLLGAVRTKNAAGMDVTVDDTLGELSELSFSKERIDVQILAGFSKDSQTAGQEQANQQGEEMMTYYQEILSDIMEEVTPQKLQTLLSEGLDGVMEMSLETMKDSLTEVIASKQADKEYAAYQLETLRKTAKNSEEAVSFLENYSIEPNLRNIVTTNAFFTKGKSFFKEMDKNADNEYREVISGFSDAVEDADTLQGEYEEVEKQIDRMIRQEYETNTKEETTESIDRLRLLSNGIALAKRLSSQEYYQIPILEGEQIATMNLVLLKGTSDSGKVSFHLDSEKGRMEGEFQVKENAIKGFILCDSKDGLDAMNQAKSSMESGFTRIGLKVGQISIGYDKKSGLFAMPKEKNEETSTNQLYQVAKIAVKAIAKTLNDGR